MALTKGVLPSPEVAGSHPFLRSMSSRRSLVEFGPRLCAVSIQAWSQSNDALWKEGGGAAGWGGILFVFCLPLFFLKGRLVLLPLIRKVCAKVQLFLRHYQLRGWWGTKAHSWLVGLGAPVAPHMWHPAPCMPPPLLKDAGPGPPQATRILTPETEKEADPGLGPASLLPGALLWEGWFNPSRLHLFEASARIFSKMKELLRSIRLL